MDYGIMYSIFLTMIEGYNNANWISNLDEVKSTSDYVFTFGGGVVS